MTSQEFQADPDRVLELRKALSVPIIQEAIAILKESGPDNEGLWSGFSPHEAHIRLGDICGWARFPRRLQQMAEHPVDLTPVRETYKPDPDEDEQ